MSYTSMYLLGCLIANIASLQNIIAVLVFTLTVFTLTFGLIVLIEKPDINPKYFKMLVIALLVFAMSLIPFKLMPTRNQLIGLGVAYIIENDILPLVKDFCHSKTETQCENGMYL